MFVLSLHDMNGLYPYSLVPSEEIKSLVQYAENVENNSLGEFCTSLGFITDSP